MPFRRYKHSDMKFLYISSKLDWHTNPANFVPPQNEIISQYKVTCQTRTILGKLNCCFYFCTFIYLFTFQVTKEDFFGCLQIFSKFAPKFWKSTTVPCAIFEALYPRTNFLELVASGRIFEWIRCECLQDKSLLLSTSKIGYVSA